MSNLSRRSLVTSAAALPALAVPAIATASSDAVQIANKMLVEYGRLGTLGRDIEGSDWALYRSLHEELWGAPSGSIDGVIAKARVLDQRLRCGGQPHSILEQRYAWRIVDDLLAMGVQS